MKNLHRYDITTLYVGIADALPPAPPHAGRPTVLSDAELLTGLLWCSAVVRLATLKEVHCFLRAYHLDEFPRLPEYSAFVRHCHRALPALFSLLRQSLAAQHSPLAFCDSTMLEVCRLVRADHHRTAKSIAAFGKNHQGWHYGFKLHAACDLRGLLQAVALTPANVHDAQALPDILSPQVKVAVGDTHYGARVMRRRMWEEYGTIIIAPPHPKQKTQVAALWQTLLLKQRPRIEATFDELKENVNCKITPTASTADSLLIRVNNAAGNRRPTGGKKSRGAGVIRP